MKEKSLIVFFVALIMLSLIAEIAVRHSRLGGSAVLVAAVAAIWGPLLYWKMKNRLDGKSWVTSAALFLFLGIFGLDHSFFRSYWGWFSIVNYALLMLILFGPKRLRPSPPVKKETARLPN
jgi:hypothetical protein